MYFTNRSQAGKLLADRLEPKYKHQNCVVIALSDGGAVVAAHIAARLKGVLTMLLTAPITLPQENDAIAVVDQEGGFVYNSMFSTGELEELESEYRTYIEEEKVQKLHELHQLLGGQGLIKRELLKNRNVILVSDGFSNGFSLEAAAGFLRYVKIKRLIVATPLASVQAVDRMHILADEIVCLSVVGNYMVTEHYYQEDDIPDHDSIIKSLQQISLHWK